MNILNEHDQFLEWIRRSGSDENLQELLKGMIGRATNEERAAVVEKPDDEHKPTIPVLLRVLDKKGVTIKDLKRVPAYEDLKGKAKEGS